MKSKLTSEDLEWLEQRLSTAMAPVEPRAEFVHDAKQALLTHSLEDRDQNNSVWLSAVSALLLGFGLTLLVMAILFRRRSARNLGKTNECPPAPEAQPALSY